MAIILKSARIDNCPARTSFELANGCILHVAMTLSQRSRLDGFAAKRGSHPDRDRPACAAQTLAKAFDVPPRNPVAHHTWTA